MANLNKGQLKTLSDNTFFDNDEWKITPDTHREFNNKLIEAMAMDEDVQRIQFLPPEECKIITDVIFGYGMGHGYDNAELLARINNPEEYPHYASLFEKLKSMEEHNFFIRVPFELHEEEENMELFVRNSYVEMNVSMNKEGGLLYVLDFKFSRYNSDWYTAYVSFEIALDGDTLIDIFANYRIKDPATGGWVELGDVSGLW
ncbi:hypothetical protein LJB95_03185 [Paludibacteraceae bacterium OttesenSCG-928-F17]|nr:hypothetical protein [Paludibacteraceae bacterium OttesenSCG-928-F17]